MDDPRHKTDYPHSMHTIMLSDSLPACYDIRPWRSCQVGEG